MYQRRPKASQRTSTLHTSPSRVGEKVNGWSVLGNVKITA